MSRWRHRARLAVLALVVLWFVWGGVRIADPFGADPVVDRVDADDPPARIAYVAMMQTETGSYVVDEYHGNGTSRQLAETLRVDGADRQYRRSLDWDDDGSLDLVYYRAESVWVRALGTDGSPPSPWSRGSVAAAPNPAFRFVEESTVLRANVTVVDRNASVVVVRVDDTDTAIRLSGEPNATDGGERPVHASLTLVVDRDDGRLRRSVFRVSRPAGPNAARETEVVVQRFRRWGAVDVKRPDGVPYTFRGLWFDMANECACVGDAA